MGFDGLARQLGCLQSSPGSVKSSSQFVKLIDIMPGHTKHIPAQDTASAMDDSICVRLAFGSNSVVSHRDRRFAQSAAAATVTPSRCVGSRLLLQRRCPKQLPTSHPLRPCHSSAGAQLESDFEQAFQILMYCVCLGGTFAQPSFHRYPKQ